MPIPKRGLSSIQTLAGRTDQVRLPYRGYMQITCLEMEKARRSVERQNALARVATIDLRLLGIEREKAALLAWLEQPGQAPPVSAPKRGLAVRQRSAGRQDAGTFKIRY